MPVELFFVEEEEVVFIIRVGVVTSLLLIGLPPDDESRFDDEIVLGYVNG